MRSHVSAARAEDPEGIHQLRVASRRLRAALTEYRPAIESEPRQRLNTLAREITQHLGRARELDVMETLLMVEREPLKGVARLAVNEALACVRSARQAARGDVAHAADLADSLDLDQSLLDVFAALHAPKKCHLKHVQARLGKRWEALCACFDTWMSDADDEILHDLRKAAKKFRYSCELYLDLYPRGLEDFINGLKTVQQDVGMWNDYRVLRAELKRCASEADRHAAPGFPEVFQTLDERITIHRDAFQAHAATFFGDEHRHSAAASFRLVDGVCCRKR
ncbi:MAG: CHAD domain-containing protein [Candidatus Hydrogenedentes bacterium]|nr:CHAD domain-containing protein [Candidatus Hydrogenedentota bacterium]